jgi:hypothetical protein
MEEMQERKRRWAIVGLLLTGTALGAPGCGGDDDVRANRARPPSTIIITASVSTEEVSVSPTRFGAGPIRLIVANQTGASQQVTLESDDAPGAGPGVRQQTAPINPRDTASLSADVEPGRYRVAVEGDGIEAATVTVGAQRASAQNEVLQP